MIWPCTSTAASKLPESPLEKLRYTVGTPLSTARSKAARNTGTGTCAVVGSSPSRMAW